MHKSRLGALNLDCETDDLEAAAEFWSAALGGEAGLHGDPEGRYIEIIGDTVVEVMERWTVMQAPTGHRYRIVRARRDGFADKAIPRN